MRIALFCHSLISDWNHGNAHFLRGITADLLERGHDVRVYEPTDAWSVQNLVAEHGEGPLEEFAREFPHLSSVRYNLAGTDLDAAHLQGLAHRRAERREICDGLAGRGEERVCCATHDRKRGFEFVQLARQ